MLKVQSDHRGIPDMTNACELLSEQPDLCAALYILELNDCRGQCKSAPTQRPLPNQVTFNHQRCKFMCQTSPNLNAGEFL